MIQLEQNFDSCDEEAIQLLNLNINLTFHQHGCEGTMTEFYFSWWINPLNWFVIYDFV